jgi:hypothetical protein
MTSLAGGGLRALFFGLEHAWQELRCWVADYSIATRILRDGGRGQTVIVSPLLALMQNQIEAADRLGIRALTINSTSS